MVFQSWAVEFTSSPWLFPLEICLCTLFLQWIQVQTWAMKQSAITFAMIFDKFDCPAVDRISGFNAHKRVAVLINALLLTRTSNEYYDAYNTTYHFLATHKVKWISRRVNSSSVLGLSSRLSRLRIKGLFVIEPNSSFLSPFILSANANGPIHSQRCPHWGD